jgi:hypothetical protein
MNMPDKLTSSCQEESTNVWEWPACQAHFVVQQMAHGVNVFFPLANFNPVQSER